MQQHAQLKQLGDVAADRQGGVQVGDQVWQRGAHLGLSALTPGGKYRLYSGAQHLDRHHSPAR